MKHIVEIGCTDKMSLHEFARNASRVQIIEPMPKHITKIQNTYKDFPQVEIHPFAIWKEACVLKMYDIGVISYADGLNSPAITEFNYAPQQKDELQIEAKTFDEFDDGTIDMIDIDTEGAEWYVLQKMISHPRIIVLETSWGNYTNPFLQEIEKWMGDNNYAPIAQDGANTFYKRFGM